MARDAFGREQDEDALEGMGWEMGGEHPPPPNPVPSAAPVQASTPPAPPAPTPLTPAGPAIPATTFAPPALRLPDLTPPRRRGGGIAAVFGLVVVGAVVFAIIGIAGSNTSIHLPKIPKPDFPTTAKPPKGLDAKSMLRRGNLAPALRKIQDAVGGKPRLVRIEAERVDVQVVADKQLVQVQMRWDSDTPDVFSRSPSPLDTGFSWSKVNPSAPARIVRATTKSGHAGDFQYAVLLDAAGLRWSAYTATGGGFLADTKGRGVKPIGG